MSSKATQWFKENVSENEKELKEIGMLARSWIHDNLSLSLPDDDEGESAIAIYGVIFNEICNEIVDQEKEWDTFSLDIANRLKIGYTTTDDEDDEKAGNFMVYMQNTVKDIDNSSDAPKDEDEEKTIELATQWNAANIKAQADVLKSIAARGKKALDEVLSLKSETHEIIIPIFCMTHTCILKYLKMKKEELQKSEYEINIAGLYTVGIQETDEAEEDIYYVPSISLKLKFKNDSIASSDDK